MSDGKIGDLRQASAHVLRREWDGEIVIYHPISGRTHLIDTLSDAILDLLVRQSIPPSAVVGELARLTGLDVEVLEERVTEVLNAFDAAGLAKRGGA